MKQRTTILIFLLAFIFINLNYAQNYSFGIKGGLNLAKLGGSDVSNVDSRTTFNAGGFVEFVVSDFIGIQPELLFTMKGAKEKFDYEGVTLKSEVKLTYLEIPVLFKLYVPVEGVSFKPFIYAGPSIGFKLSSKIKVSSGGESVEEDIEDLKSTDFGFNFGVGSNIGPIIIGIRYNLGLTSIDDSADPDDVKNRVLSFNVGFGF